MRHFGWFSNVVSITYLVNLKGKILETIKAREPDLLFPSRIPFKVTLKYALSHVG